MYHNHLKLLHNNNNNNNNNNLFTGLFTTVTKELILSPLVQINTPGKGLSRGRVLFTLVMDNRTNLYKHLKDK